MAKTEGFEWDLNKAAANVEKHQVRFSDASRIWEGLVFERPDARRDYGEKRFIALGAVEGRVHVVAFTHRGQRRRIISARKANEREQRQYRAALAGCGAEPTEEERRRQAPPISR